jgi:helicase MOV-10
MSTVRSQTKHVGFLRNEKRLNVALTRAKSLLIIIGNSSTLQRCLIWNKFIAFCYKNRAVVGDAMSLDKSIVNDRNYKGNEEKPEDFEDEYDL